MHSKLITAGVLVASAAALGGVYILMDTDEISVDPAVASLYAQAQQQEFSTATFDPMGVQEVEQRVPDASQRGGSQGEFGRFDFAARMSMFDLDGDGVLSDEERDAMRQAIRAEMLERFDLDGDGEISREERQAARQARFENSNRGQDLMRQFDLDGDGELSVEEQAAMDLYLEEQRQARRDDQLAQYDLDGDGELSQEERQLQREDRQESRQEMMDSMTDEFDEDGDGQLNIEEQQAAFAAMQERREIDRFLAQYDTDGNGVMGASDYDTFASDYGNGDLGADVNNDGVVDTQDLAAYRDLVTRSGNRP